MSNYTKLTSFASKDSLTSGSPSKVIRGSEIDAEYDALETAIQTKADLNNPTFTGTATFANVSITGSSTISKIDGGTF